MASRFSLLLSIYTVLHIPERSGSEKNSNCQNPFDSCQIRVSKRHIFGTNGSTWVFLSLFRLHLIGLYIHRISRKKKFRTVKICIDRYRISRTCMCIFLSFLGKLIALHIPVHWKRLLQTIYTPLSTTDKSFVFIKAIIRCLRYERQTCIFKAVNNCLDNDEWVACYR